MSGSSPWYRSLEIFKVNLRYSSLCLSKYLLLLSISMLTVNLYVFLGWQPFKVASEVEYHGELKLNIGKIRNRLKLEHDYLEK